LNKRKALILGLIVIGPILWGILWYRAEGKLKPLQIYGDQEMDGSTTPWVIPDFKLIDQNGDTVTKADLKDKIVVANFFYATCPEVCPRMNKEIQLVAYKFTQHPDVLFLSHSVNPEYDTASVLKEYSRRFNLPDDKWKFLTGSKREIYDLAENHYRAVAVKSDGADDFIHSTTVVLLDKEQRIRGFFESMDNPKFFNDVKGAIQVLIKEYKLQEDEQG